MEVRFLVDLDTGLPHIDQHGVTPTQVLDVLRHRKDDAAGRDGARIAEGQTAEGRYLRVIYRVIGFDNSILVVTHMIFQLKHYAPSAGAGENDHEEEIPKTHYK